MATIPSTEPTVFTAGDTVQWTRSDLGDYPATTWTLTYTFYNISKSFSVTATASGTGFAVTIAKATTAGYTAGDYKWDAYVTDGTSRYKVDSGYCTVKADTGALTGGTGYDYSSTIKKIFDAIEAVIYGRASKDQSSYTIAGRTLERTPIADLIRLRNFYKSELERELAAEAIERGDAPKGKIRIRFRTPS